uniref:Uncharacterized protein n=1 Tax=Davidia involucrata TaxID=16924 RepID=A0A5B7C591_DAVIN
MVPDMATDAPPVPEEQFMVPPQAAETDNPNPLLSLDLSLKSDFEPKEAASHVMVEEAKETVTPSDEIPPVVPAFFPAFLPVPFPFPFPLWLSNADPPEEERGVETSHHQVLKPIPVFTKEPVNVDELGGMSQLSLGETETGHSKPSPLSLKLLGAPSRQSAFHASTPANGPTQSKQFDWGEVIGV